MPLFLYAYATSGPPPDVLNFVGNSMDNPAMKWEM